MVLDCNDADKIRDKLENDIAVFEEGKKIEASIFDAAGGFSPTLGIIGTVMGLIQVLGNMSSAEELTKSIATAFIATLYGVCFANLVYLPIANKLKLKLKISVMEKDMIITGLVALCNGDNARSIKELLESYNDFDGLKKK